MIAHKTSQQVVYRRFVLTQTLILSANYIWYRNLREICYKSCLWYERQHPNQTQKLTIGLTSNRVFRADVHNIQTFDCYSYLKEILIFNHWFNHLVINTNKSKLNLSWISIEIKEKYFQIFINHRQNGGQQSNGETRL